MGLKFGVVSQVDAAKGLVRVKFEDNDGLESYWLHVTAAATMRNKVYALPDLGEGVACLVDDNCEAGVVLGAIYSQQDPPPVTDSNKFHIAFEDGTTLEYDRKAHKLTARVQGAVDVEATDDICAASGKVLALEAAELVSIRTPRFEIRAAQGETCDALWNANLRLRGQLDHVGDYQHQGNQFNEGDVTATGTIMDQNGNSNHHVH